MSVCTESRGSLDGARPAMAGEWPRQDPILPRTWFGSEYVSDHAFALKALSTPGPRLSANRMTSSMLTAWLTSVVSSWTFRRRPRRRPCTGRRI